MFTLAAVSVFLANVLSYSVNTAFVKDDIISIQKVKTREAILLIDSFLDIHTQRVRDQSAHLYSLIYQYEGDANLSLQQFLNSNPLYREESLVEQNGKEIWRVSRHTFFSKDEMRDLREDDLLIQTIQQNKCFHNEIQRNPFGEPLIQWYCPILNDKKEVSHVLIHSMSLKPLWDILDAITMGETGFAFVVNREGDIIAYPDFSEGLNRTNVTRLPVFNRLVQANAKFAEEHQVISDKEADFLYSGGISKASGWLVLVRQDISEANRPLSVIAFASLGGMAVFLVMGGIVSTVISKRFTAPLQALSYGVGSFAEGDLSFAVQVQSKDEFGDLSRGLNEMAERLQKTTVSRDYVDNIIASMLHSLIVISPCGEIKTVNNATCELLGYSEEELIGRSFGAILDDGFLANLERGEGDLAEELQKKERNYRTKDGRDIPVLFSGSLMHYSAGTVQGIVCMAQDISELKKAEFKLKKFSDRLAESNKELADFAHIASHDLQEPLRKVTAFADRLQQKSGDSLSEQSKDYLNRMRSATVRMRKLIDGLLSFSRVTTKARPFETVDLAKVVEEVLSDLEIRIELTQGAVEVGELPAIDADPLQMRQLFQNLIGNALKFMKPGDAPVVKVSSKDINEWRKRPNAAVSIALCQITVEDNGIGFEEKYVDRIFGVFQRLHGRSEYEGTGIGLSVCKKIVERHAGSISATSAPGKGAAFVFSLPIKQIKEDENDD
ncbi:PAS domain S-box protein [bacterium AH-315-L15]|nr:PAS domain S-box protein [bacterium AH-315-L15]